VGLPRWVSRSDLLNPSSCTFLLLLLWRLWRCKRLLERTHRNVATVALANKLARIAWAVLAHDRRFVALHIGG
jgi:hypothetical protein